MDELLYKIKHGYSDLLSVKDVIALGLFSSPDMAWEARKYGRSPDYIKMHHKILYPKESIIQFLKDRFKKGGECNMSSRAVTPDGSTAT